MNNRLDNWEPLPLYYKQREITSFRPEDNDEVLMLNSPENAPRKIIEMIKNRDYRVGSTTLYAEPVDSWKRYDCPTDYPNQYLPYAIKELSSSGIKVSLIIKLFFSTDNIEYLQSRIIEEVKKHTKETINKQNTDELLKIMVQIMQLYYSSTECIHSMREKLERLNKSVLENAVRKVIMGINQYKYYINDITTLKVPLERPKLMTMKGSRILSESVGFNNGLDQTRLASAFNVRNNVLDDINL